MTCPRVWIWPLHNARVTVRRSTARVVEDAVDDPFGSVLGSTADLSLRSTRCSTVIIQPRAREMRGCAKYAVGVDGSDNSRKAIEVAQSLLQVRAGA